MHNKSDLRNMNTEKRMNKEKKMNTNILKFADPKIISHPLNKHLSSISVLMTSISFLISSSSKLFSDRVPLSSIQAYFWQKDNKNRKVRKIIQYIYLFIFLYASAMMWNNNQHREIPFYSNWSKQFRYHQKCNFEVILLVCLFIEGL